MTREYDNLSACALTPDMHERTCGYWYTVRNGSNAHTAFATRHGLDNWLRERALVLEDALPEGGGWGVSRIIGSYRERLYLYDVKDFQSVQPLVVTAVMSNGDYTLGLITKDDDGVRTVHYLNPNVKTRMIFDYKRTRELLS